VTPDFFTKNNGADTGERINLAHNPRWQCPCPVGEQGQYAMFTILLLNTCNYNYVAPEPIKDGSLSLLNVINVRD